MNTRVSFPDLFLGRLNISLLIKIRTQRFETRQRLPAAGAVPQKGILFSRNVIHHLSPVMPSNENPNPKAEHDQRHGKILRPTASRTRRLSLFRGSSRHNFDRDFDVYC